MAWVSLNEEELSRLANAFFTALPGAGSPPPGGPSPSALDALEAPPADDPSGWSSAADISRSVGLGGPARLDELQPGAGVPPLGVQPGVGAFSPPPGVDVDPARLSGAHGAPLSPPAEAKPPAGPAPDLYIFAEAEARQAVLPHAASPPEQLAARPDALPGADALAAIFGLDQPPAPPPPRAAGEDEFLQAPAVANSGHPAFDANAIRRDFPILAERVNGRPLVWLDNGATTQKPQAVIDRLKRFYEHENSNVHRAAHTLAARATDAYENARKISARFIGAASPDEIVFVRGSTEGINLVAQAWGRNEVREGDEIVISHLEHHANIVPWQQLAAEKGARLRVIPVDDRGDLILSEYQRLLSDRTRIVAVTHVSNALGTLVPIDKIVELGHAAGAKVLIDAAQSAAHSRLNVRALDADFLVLSGHKIFAPTGIGLLYGKREILEKMQPWQGGGNMIADVTFEKTIYQPAPARFEAGTGNLADAVGLGAAFEYLERIGLENIARHEHDLLAYAAAGLATVSGLSLIGAPTERVSVLSFLLDGFEPHEVGEALDKYGIAVRAGHHCAQPILRRFGLEGTVRASLALYNTVDDVDCLVAALRQISASRGLGLKGL